MQVLLDGASTEMKTARCRSWYILGDPVQLSPWSMRLRGIHGRRTMTARLYCQICRFAELEERRTDWLSSVGRETERGGEEAIDGWANEGRGACGCPVLPIVVVKSDDMHLLLPRSPSRILCATPICPS